MPISADRRLVGLFTDQDGSIERYIYSLNDLRNAYSVRAQSAGPLSSKDRKAFEDLTYWMVLTEAMKEVDPNTYPTVLDLELEKPMMDMLARDDFYDEKWVRVCA